jgi:hypothetical protein
MASSLSFDGRPTDYTLMETAQTAGNAAGQRRNLGTDLVRPGDFDVPQDLPGLGH